MDRITRCVTEYSTSHEIERETRDRTAGGGRGMIMSISYRQRTVAEKKVGSGQTLEEFYGIHNLDEKRRKYLEDLKSQLKNLGGPLNNLLNAMGLDY